MIEIHTEAEYQAALAEIEDLLTVEGDTPGSEQVDALVQPVEEYEAEHFHLDEADPAR